MNSLISPFQSCSLSHWGEKELPARVNPPHTERWNISCQLRDAQNSHFYINIHQKPYKKHKFSLPAFTPQQNFCLFFFFFCWTRVPSGELKWLQVEVHTGHLVDLSLITSHEIIAHEPDEISFWLLMNCVLSRREKKQLQPFALIGADSLQIWAWSLEKAQQLMRKNPLFPQ